MQYLQRSDISGKHAEEYFVSQLKVCGNHWLGKCERKDLQTKYKVHCSKMRQVLVVTEHDAENWTEGKNTWQTSIFVKFQLKGNTKTVD